MRKADSLPPSCAVVTKSGSLNFLEPSGPLQACNGTDLPLPFFVFACSIGLTVGAGKSSLSIGMSMERRWNVTDVENRRNQKEKNLSRCHVVYRKYHMDWPESEPGPLRFVHHRAHCAAFRVIIS